MWWLPRELFVIVIVENEKFFPIILKDRCRKLEKGAY